MTLRFPFIPAAVALAPLALGSFGCASAPPPASQLPNADAAVARMHATTDSCVAVQAKAKIDHFGKQAAVKRIRADLLMFVAVPARLRMDIVSPFGVNVATLTSDGSRFALADLRDKRFYSGPAKACNIARLTSVPVPGPVLVDLLRGEAPVLVHGARAGLADTSRIAWSSKGYYVVNFDGRNETTEEIHLAPRPEDLGKPWSEQRMRVLEVVVRQQGLVLYRAELEGHTSAAMAKPRVDPEGIDAPIPPSGAVCTAELPRRVHVEVPGLEEDVLFRYDEVTWNPPLPRDIFQQPQPPGLQPFPVDCD